MLSKRHPLRSAQALIEGGHLWPLAPLAAAHAGLVELRNRCFDWGLLARHSLPVPVISVGNLIAGGSGKTPLVAWLLRSLQGLGHRPAVLARGYGAGADAAANDEALMLDGQVYCHPRRSIAGQRALQDGADCLILDDGFQHRSCARNLDLLCMDATRPWGWPGSWNGALLPWGMLREPRQSLRRAHGLIVSRCDQAPRQLLTAIRRLADAHGLPFWPTWHCPSGLRDMSGREQALDLTALRGQRLLLCSAIARPQAFTQTVGSLGGRVLGHRAFPDHYRYSTQDIIDLQGAARSLRARLLCTAKDAVKIAPLMAACISQLPSADPAPCWVLDTQLEFMVPEHAQALHALLQQCMLYDAPPNRS